MDDGVDDGEGTDGNDDGGIWPLTYLECRERFRLAAARSGVPVRSLALDAVGPGGEGLTIDVARLGPVDADRVVVVMSGTHGIEGFAGSVIQADLLGRLAGEPEVGLVLIHAANPWGMAWWRRANENNVDLNRNWHDFDPAGAGPSVNEAYAEVHDLLCPDELDDGTAFVAELGRLAGTRGLNWVRSAISSGQYSHPDGLYYGGSTREPSVRALAEVFPSLVGPASTVFGVDLHTGLGAYGTYTLLSRVPPGSPEDLWLRTEFDADRIITTAPGPDADAVVRQGPLLPGLLSEVEAARTYAVTFELGTRSETRSIVAERAEHVVHRSGVYDTPDHAAVRWEHRICSIPDDREWERAGLAHGRLVVDTALDAVTRL